MFFHGVPIRKRGGGRHLRCIVTGTYVPVCVLCTMYVCIITTTIPTIRNVVSDEIQGQNYICTRRLPALARLNKRSRFSVLKVPPAFGFVEVRRQGGVRHGYQGITLGEFRTRGPFRQVPVSILHARGFSVSELVIERSVRFGTSGSGCTSSSRVPLRRWELSR